MTALYSLPSSDFHDITIGYNGGYSAGPGYDEVTGIGTPVANAARSRPGPYGITSKLVVSPPSIDLAGNTFSVTVAGEDNLGDINTSFNGTVALSLTSNPGGSTLSGTLTATAVNGVATFTGLSLNDIGVGYVFTAQTVLGTGTLKDASSPFAVSPAAATPYNQSVSAPLSPTDGAGHTLTYTAQVGGFSSLFAVEQQFLLVEPSGTTTYDYNANGDQEKYFVSTNGSNAANNTLYFILPTGLLYAWNGISISSSISAGPVQFQGASVNVGASAYAYPPLLIDALPPYNPSHEHRTVPAIAAAPGHDEFLLQSAQ